MKNMICPPQVNPSLEFSLSEWNQATFDTMPDFIKDKIRMSKEYIQMFAPSLVVAPAVVTPPVAAAPAMKNEDAYHYSQQDESDPLPF
jgi:hypothetical protein